MSTETLEPIEVLDEQRVRVKCRKCNTPITLDFGGMTRSEAEAVVNTLDRTPRECPGYHVELSGWRRLWRMDEALDAIYPAE